VRSGQWESGGCVIEYHARPAGCGMASLAGSCEACCCVRWSIGAVVVRFVAPVTIGRGIGEIPVQMTGSTGNGHVKTGKGECGLVVVKRRGLPRGSRMARRAGCGNPRGNVRGIGGAVEILGMARITVRRRCGVIAVDVAQGASDRYVRARERERRFAVVERRRLPRGSVVADGACRGNSRGSVRRICRAVEIFGVARIAIRRNGTVVVVNVARTAGNAHMCAGERERGLVVIESCGLPGGSCVANRAGSWNARL